MPLPKSVDIFGWKIKVVEKPLAKDGLCGLASYKEKTIYIDEKMNKEEKMHTLLHEMWHFMSMRMSIHQMEYYNPAIEELYCEKTADFILENFNLTPKRKSNGKQKNRRRS